jgi:hypothetical protein
MKLFYLIYLENEKFKNSKISSEILNLKDLLLKIEKNSKKKKNMKK